MQVGDVVRFFDSGYIGVIVGFTDFEGVTIFVTSENVTWKNPSTMNDKVLRRYAEVISAAR